MPPREAVAEYYYHKILAGMIEEVLRKPSGRVRVSELAASAGFSRFHLTRLFHSSAEETLELFLRRMRLERAAYLLLNSDRRIHQVAVECGYRSPEAFSRAFRRAFGCLPTEAKETLETWEIECISDLHWNADWVLENHTPEFNDQIVAVPTRFACVARIIGDYAQLADGWQQLEAEQLASIPKDGKFITIYHDNLWTHPVCRTLKADIGWLCGADDVVPRGMRKTVIPGGCYATTRIVDREERTPAWSAMWGRYSRSMSERKQSVAYDEYEAWPLPFEAVRTRILIGLNLDREKSAQKVSW